jgi:hypothetical protein
MELDRQILAETFDMEDIERQVDRLTLVSEDDPEEVIKENIKRANRILDIVEGEIERGNITARMVEVASALMNTVTASSKEVMSNINYKKYLQVREAMVKYKYDELEVKKNQYRTPTSQNIILSDRESVLKFLSGEIKKIE